MASFVMVGFWRGMQLYLLPPITSDDFRTLVTSDDSWFPPPAWSSSLASALHFQETVRDVHLSNSSSVMQVEKQNLLFSYPKASPSDSPPLHSCSSPGHAVAVLLVRNFGLSPLSPLLTSYPSLILQILSSRLSFLPPPSHAPTLV